MIKYVALLKRRPGMDFQAFKDYYETRHAILGREHMHGVRRYQRRFLKPMDHPFAGGAEEAFDCITEVWFDDKNAMNAAFAHLSKPDIAKIFADDEDQIFDRKRTRCFVVDEECDTDYGSVV